MLSDPIRSDMGRPAIADIPKYPPTFRFRLGLLFGPCVFSLRFWFLLASVSDMRALCFLFVLLARSLSTLAPKLSLSESTLDWVIFGVAVGIGVWFDRPYSSWAGTVWMGLGWSGLEWSG